MSFTKNVRRFMTRRSGTNSSGSARRSKFALSRSEFFESLEERVVLSSVGAFWSISGTVLNLTLGGSKTLTLTSTASSTYTMVVSGGGTLSNTWGAGASNSYVSSSSNTATVSTAGQGYFTQINISEVSGQTGVSLTFADSGSNNYVNPFLITLNDTPGAVTFNGSTNFATTNALSVTTDSKIVVSSGASVSTANGSLTFKANVADTSTAGATFGAAGIDINNATVQVTGTGLLDLEGRGGEGTNTSPYGVYVRAGGQVSGGSSGNNQVLGWGPTNGTTAGNAGVYVNGYTGSSDSTITTNGGNLTVNGVARGAITSGSDVSVGVYLNSGGVITAGGSGTVTVNGTGGSGNTANGNSGVYVKGVGASSSYPSTITSGGGTVSVTGTGNGSSTAASNFGVAISGGGLVSSGGNGVVSVTGTGGDTTGNSNQGVYVTGTSSTLKSGGTGTVTVNGFGGGGPTSGNGFAMGVNVTNGGTVTSGGAGKVLVRGTGNARTASTSFGNYGVSVASSNTGIGTITSGGGNLEVRGTGGGTMASGGSNGHGVNVGTGGLITSGGTGNVMVAGTATTAAGGTNNYGIYINGTATYNSVVYTSTITSGGKGTVTVTGQGGGTGAAGSNYGVNVCNAGSDSGTISSGGGNVVVNGTGGGNTGTNNSGLRLAGYATITAGGSGTVTVSGTGGSPSSSGAGPNYGVYVTSNSGYGILSGTNGGNVVVNGTEGGGGSGGTASVGVSVASGTISTATNGGDLTITTNSLKLGVANAVQTKSSNSLSNIPKTSGVGFNLGSTSDTLGGPIAISNTELNDISSGTIYLGDSNTGPISISAAMTVPSGSNLSLATASSSAGLTPSGGSVDLSLSSPSLLDIYNIPSVNITINGPAVDSGYTQFSVAGAPVDLAGMTLNLSDAYQSVAGDVFTIVSAPAGLSGTFAGLDDGTTMTLNGRTLVIQYTATSVTLSDPPPAVTTNPVSQAVFYGDTVIFTAAASGTPAPDVQWQVNTGSGFVDIPGANSTTLSFSATLPQYGYQYCAVFTNAYGTATSSTATLYVFKANTTTTLASSANPSAYRARVTFTATVTAGATGTVTFKDGSTTLSTVTLSGGAAAYSSSSLTSGSHSITAVYGGDANHFSSTSTAVTQVVAAAPLVTGNPSAQTVNAGATATFTASGIGNPAPTVQWQISTNGGTTWATISGATSTTYTTPALTVGNDGSLYRAVFINNLGSAATSAALLHVNSAPAITGQPASMIANIGATATFTATASGYSVPTVQWQKNTGGGWNDIVGATSNSYTTAGTEASGTQFRAVFTNTLGTATTNAATLTVAVVANVTGISVGWGTQTAALVDAGSGRLLPAGRSMDIPWLGINKLTLNLDQSIASLTAGSITIKSAAGFSYSVSSVSGSGNTWMINLGGSGLVNADKVTVAVSSGSVATYSKRLDVLPGDVNDDGLVSSLDQMLVSRQISVGYLVMYDVDGDGTLTSNDVTQVKSRIGNKLTA